MTIEKRGKPIPEFKINAVKELAGLIKNKKTILIASIKNLPASQFQEIGKKLRGKAIVKVPKKNLFFRAIKDSGNKDAEQLKECFENSIALLFSDLDSYELAGELIKNKSPAKAKPGQEAPTDIEIQAGPTELVPGPAISELGAVGLQVQIEKGKITIRESRVIVKEGKKISKAAADVMTKLDIKPFSIGFVPLCSFDNESKKLYLDIKIDKEGTIKSLQEAYGKALPFAVEIGYSSSETITFLIGKAGMHEKALSNLEKTEEVSETESKAKDSEKSEPKEETPVEAESKAEAPAEPENTQTPDETKSKGEEK